MSRGKKDMETLSVGLFLIGLAVVFLVDSISFWPWILAVIGIAWLPSNFAKEKGVAK